MCPVRGVTMGHHGGPGLEAAAPGEDPADRGPVHMLLVRLLHGAGDQFVDGGQNAEGPLQRGQDGAVPGPHDEAAESDLIDPVVLAVLNPDRRGRTRCARPASQLLGRARLVPAPSRRGGCSRAASASRSRGSLPSTAEKSAGEPPSTARPSGVVPSGSTRSGSAPPSTNASATCSSYAVTATHSTGSPFVSTASGSAPLTSRSRTASASRARTAGTSRPSSPSSPMVSSPVLNDTASPPIRRQMSAASTLPAAPPLRRLRERPCDGQLTCTSAGSHPQTIWEPRGKDLPPANSNAMGHTRHRLYGRAGQPVPLRTRH